MSRVLSSIWLVLALGLTLAQAAGETHWAYRPLAAKPPPARPGQNPIDAFIQDRLTQAGGQPAPAADQRTWLRRVYFDLLGLPPTPEEMAAFLADSQPGARERVVDRLLASPRHGERWARHWMDAIHFAETHGHDQDRIRTNAWPYRDYLVASFNQDKPYARFVQEQVAGDILFPDDPQATVALGFLAAGPWDESSLRDIREDSIDRQIGRYLDRDDVVTTVMQTFTSTTVHCARCHDHKFDPIPQRDYYALQAVFAGVDRANRVYDADPAVHQRRQALRQQQQRLNTDRTWLLGQEAGAAVEKFEREYQAAQKDWRILAATQIESVGGATLSAQPDHSVLSSGLRPDRDTNILTGPSPLPEVSALRLEALTDATLPKNGPGRQDNGNLHLSEFQVFVSAPGAAAWRAVPIRQAQADFNQSGWTIQHALDGQDKTAWGIFPKVGEAHQAIFFLEQPLRLAVGSRLKVVLRQVHGGGHLLGRFRLSVSAAEQPARTALLPEKTRSILELAPASRIEEQRAALAAHVLGQRLERELAALPKPALVYAAAADFEPDGGLKPAGRPREVRVLRRGEINKPQEVASPGTLSCLSALPARFDLADPMNEGQRRAALARWLTAPENALTWRSVVNRIWHLHFGRGLVETPNDFGKMAAPPSHPELLDWMALWFRDEARGSWKALHRLIVTSATYGQRSEPGPEALADADNRLLARMPRSRLDADQVRDAILQISGQLDLRMGGPGDQQFDLQPGHHVTPRVDYTKFDVDSAAGRRRSVYRFLFRTLPDPFMDALDCPAGDQLTPVRTASVTVQQALALWNDAFVANYSEHLARRLQAGAGTVEAQVRLACELVWNRPPTAVEITDLTTYARAHGLANLCRVLFNSSEFIFVN